MKISKEEFKNALRDAASEEFDHIPTQENEIPFSFSPSFLDRMDQLTTERVKPENKFVSAYVAAVFLGIFALFVIPAVYFSRSAGASPNDPQEANWPEPVSSATELVKEETETFSDDFVKDETEAFTDDSAHGKPEPFPDDACDRPDSVPDDACDGPGDSVGNEPKAAYSFSSYDALFEAIYTPGANGYAELRFHLENYGEIYQNILSDFETDLIRPIFPEFNGQNMKLCDREDTAPITFFSTGQYHMPWIQYNCTIDQKDVTVMTSYFDSSLPQQCRGSVLDAFWYVTNSSLNRGKEIPFPENASEFPDYSSIEYGNVLFADGSDIKTFCYQLKDSSQMIVLLHYVNYSSILVAVQADRELLTESFWSSFHLATQIPPGGDPSKEPPLFSDPDPDPVPEDPNMAKFPKLLVEGVNAKGPYSSSLSYFDVFETEIGGHADVLAGGTADFVRFHFVPLEDSAKNVPSIKITAYPWYYAEGEITDVAYSEIDGEFVIQPLNGSYYYEVEAAFSRSLDDICKYGFIINSGEAEKYELEKRLIYLDAISLDQEIHPWGSYCYYNLDYTYNSGKTVTFSKEAPSDLKNCEHLQTGEARVFLKFDTTPTAITVVGYRSGKDGFLNHPVYQEEFTYSPERNYSFTPRTEADVYLINARFDPHNPSYMNVTGCCTYIFFIDPVP